MAALAHELRSDPSPFWAALAARRPALLERSRQLDASVGAVLRD